jgi:CheY-like chemotaxis protein
LVLVKQITELHGGRVTVDSQVGKGSCFTVTIPQTYSPSSAESPDPKARPDLTLDRPNLNPHTAPLILLIEDNEVTINTFSSYLTAIGYRTIVAQTQQQAIALTQSHRPDLISIDIHMSRLDSIATIEWLRQQSPQLHIPIIALTTLTTNTERQKYLACGVDRYLTKPFKLRELHRTIQECLDLN